MTRTERLAAGYLRSALTFQMDPDDSDARFDGCSDLLDEFLRRITQLETEYLQAMVGL
ncbi:hypothetical protein GCM10010260_41800 [Streptomyces filipinensis]|uniref:Uncharacterized protein n=1 Tax=Streptomyces filipinensis TaxID=66887 RepID=A0A918MBF0_9ACTN|nr:hypothetical protein GCM10010260_41800 [Streptomyces filipinensis]